MKMALKEAVKGVGRTSPNPSVGAVVVKNGEIVGKGYHRRAGTPHAEVNALTDAGKKARGATIYVTLEPCNHTGRTPPCTSAILEAGIKKVVVGMADPNPNVEGCGSDFLEKKGLTVVRDILAGECLSINRPFDKHVRTGQPWMVFKAGVSLDGKIAVSSGECAWITNEKSRRHVHRLRDRVDAILVGIGTAIADDPSLTTRLKGGRTKDPLRIVLDSNLRLSPSARMLHQDSDAKTWVFCGQKPSVKRRKDLESAGAKVIPVQLDNNGRINLKAVADYLGRARITSVLVEGGGRVHGSFLRNGLIDQVCLFVAPIFLGSDAIPVIDGLGLSSVQEAARLKDVTFRRFGDNVMLEGFF